MMSMLPETMVNVCEECDGYEDFIKKSDEERIDHSDCVSFRAYYVCASCGTRHIYKMDYECAGEMFERAIE